MRSIGTSAKAFFLVFMLQPSITINEQDPSSSPAYSAANLMLYSSSLAALGSPFLSINFTVRPSFTANTESSSKYFESSSKICVVTDLKPSDLTWRAVSACVGICALELVTYNEMNVSRSEVVAVEQVQKLSSGAITRYLRDVVNNQEQLH